ncbi:MAG: acyl carrier protein [Bacteroidota bacterium]
MHHLFQKKMDHFNQKITDILKIVAADKVIDPQLFSNLDAPLDLRNDFQLDSLDLAEFGVRIEDAFGVDLFQNGPVTTLAEVMDQLQQHSPSNA